MSVSGITNAQDESGHTPLHHAVDSSNVVLRQIILKANPDLNIQNKYGNTPLHAALDSNCKYDDDAYIEIAKKIIRNGADLTIKNNKKLTAFEQYQRLGENLREFQSSIKENRIKQNSKNGRIL